MNRVEWKYRSELAKFSGNMMWITYLEKQILLYRELEPSINLNFAILPSNEHFYYYFKQVIKQVEISKRILSEFLCGVNQIFGKFCYAGWKKIEFYNSGSQMLITYFTAVIFIHNSSIENSFTENPTLCWIYIPGAQAVLRP